MEIQLKGSVISLFSLYVLFSQLRPRGKFDPFHAQMHVNKTKFERNNSLEY